MDQDQGRDGRAVTRPEHQVVPITCVQVGRGDVEAFKPELYGSAWNGSQCPEAVQIVAIIPREVGTGDDTLVATEVSTTNGFHLEFEASSRDGPVGLHGDLHPVARGSDE